MAPRNDVSQGQVAYVNARLLDPAAGLDTAGGILTDGEAITDVGPGVTKKKAPKGARIVDCHGKCLSPDWSTYGSSSATWRRRWKPPSRVA